MTSGGRGADGGRTVSSLASPPAAARTATLAVAGDPRRTPAYAWGRRLPRASSGSRLGPAPGGGKVPGGRAPRSRRLLRALGRREVWQGIAGVAIVLAIWQIASSLRLPMFTFIPTPLQIGRSLVDVAQTR